MAGKKIQSKQEINGRIAHSLTEALLLQRFFVSRRIPDIEGADFLVQKREETLDNLRETKEKVNVWGIIQSKFFENKNEVKISKDYVVDNIGPIPEFFASIYTIRNFNQGHYFFSANEIIKHWKYSRRKSGEYYVFKISEKKDFCDFKNIPTNEILDKIENAIETTEEYRNQKLIQRIYERKAKIYENVYQNKNIELFKNIDDKYIVDKLFIALNYYKEFRRISPWRLIEKISFKGNEKKQTSTFYNLFTLITNNIEIKGFFNAIEINEEISIIDQSFFKGVSDYKRKVNKIIEILNINLIHNLNAENDEGYSIYKKQNRELCLDDLYSQLKFNVIYRQISKKKTLSNTVWDKMHKAYLYFDMGEFENAFELFEIVAKEANNQKNHVLEFLALYNINLSGRKLWKEERPILENVLYNLPVGSETKEILRRISEDQTLYYYERSIDEIYLKIKDYKQRKVVNDTYSLFRNMYAKYLEFCNFFDGNFLVKNIYNETNSLAEKVVESAIISFSMNTDHSCHLVSFNDVLVHLSIHSCQSGNLLKYFQRNNVDKVKYQSENNFFQKCLGNFFNKHNIDFLAKEICYIDRKSKNIHLRNKVVNIFGNLCYLMAYLDTNINKELLKRIIYFIESLDFTVNEVSSLAHPLLKKPELFPENDILYLTQLLSNNTSSSGYLLTNCLYTLNLKSYKFSNDQNSLIEKLISAALNEPQYRILRILPKLIDTEKRKELSTKIDNSLKNKFNRNLYYGAIFNKLLPIPKKYFNKYLEFYRELTKELNTKNPFYTRSPYTGVGEPLSRNLNYLVDIVISINDKDLLEHDIIKKVIEYHPYYKFILNIDNFNKNDQFNLDWVLENQSEIVIKKLSANKAFKEVLRKELINNYQSQIGKLYLRHFA